MTQGCCSAGPEDLVFRVGGLGSIVLWAGELNPGVARVFVSVASSLFSEDFCLVVSRGM